MRVEENKAVEAQFKIHNSKFIILSHSPLIFPEGLANFEF